MFCPECKAEYRAGFTHCADCDVNLVPALESQSAPVDAAVRAELSAPVLLWSGMDTGAFQRILAALDEAGISYGDAKPGARLLYASMRNALEVWIQKADHDAAREILAEVLGRTVGLPEGDPTLGRSAATQKENFPVALSNPVPGVVTGNPEIFASPAEYASLSGEQPEDTAPYDSLENPEDDEATAEVWSGADLSMPQMLKDCLRENGIGCFLAGRPPQNLRVMVHPEDVESAREILREITEATPLD